MAKKKTTKKSSEKKTTPKSETTGKPNFAYSTKPASLRKFLTLVPQKPKPPKINGDLLKAWGMRDTNDQTIIRVLKAIDFVSPSNEPTNDYTKYMTPEVGPAVLGQAIKSHWSPLFEASHEPHKEQDSTLKNYFNIHSGGSERVIQYQIQTFKALCEHATFDSDSIPNTSHNSPNSDPTNTQSNTQSNTQNSNGPSVNINLHIHLPENKSQRDYTYIIEDIAKHIYGRSINDE